MINEKIKRLIQSDKMNSVAVTINNLKDIYEIFGLHGRDDAMQTVNDCINMVFKEIGTCHRLSDSEFLCLSKEDIRGYVSQLRDNIGFVVVNKAYQLDISVGYKMYAG